MDTYDIIYDDITESDNVENFDCGNPVLNNFLKRESLFDSTKCVSRTKLVKLAIAEDAEIVGYFTLSFKNSRIEGNDDTFYPTIYLASLAIDKKYQNNGIGTKVLQYVIVKSANISGLTGCRCLLLDAVIEEIDFYKRNGFVAINCNKTNKRIYHDCEKMIFDFRDIQSYNNYYEE